MLYMNSEIFTMAEIGFVNYSVIIAISAFHTSKNYELLKVVENRIKQCCAAHIVKCCQQNRTSC